jgi:uncharacterized protein
VSKSGRPRRLFELRASTIQGRGGFALRAIRRGARIVEYTGERIPHAEADARYDDVRMDRHHTFLFTVDADTVIDAAVNGSAARFLNHSCDPNCAPAIEGGRVFIEARRDIAAGEELTYDYALSRQGSEDERDPARYACRCGARRCRGTMLSPRAPR